MDKLFAMLDEKGTENLKDDFLELLVYFSIKMA